MKLGGGGFSGEDPTVRWATAAMGRLAELHGAKAFALDEPGAAALNAVFRALGEAEALYRKLPDEAAAEPTGEG